MPTMPRSGTGRCGNARTRKSSRISGTEARSVAAPTRRSSSAELAQVSGCCSGGCSSPPPSPADHSRLRAPSPSSPATGSPPPPTNDHHDHLLEQSDGRDGRASPSRASQERCLMSAADWYGVRCVFAYGRGSSARASDERIGYEERVTVWRAETFDNAIAKAEAEAEGYASDVDAEYVGLAQAYRMADDLLDGAEVISLIRYIDM